jgi:hypothetical protein
MVESNIKVMAPDTKNGAPLVLVPMAMVADLLVRERVGGRPIQQAYRPPPLFHIQKQ